MVSVMSPRGECFTRTVFSLLKRGLRLVRSRRTVLRTRRWGDVVVYRGLLTID